MVEGHVDSLTLLNRVYDCFVEQSTTINNGVLDKIRFSSASQLVESWRKKHESEEDFCADVFGKKPEDRTPFNPEKVGIYSLIADDSDEHRTRQGFFKYSEGFVLPIHDEMWFISRGVPTGRYPADAYLGDIAAVPALKTIDETIQQLSKSYFRNSLLILESGPLDSPGKFSIDRRSRFSGFGSEIVETLKLGLDVSEIDSRCPTYDPIVAPMMAQLFRRILERTPIPSVAEIDSSK